MRRGSGIAAVPRRRAHECLCCCVWDEALGRTKKFLPADISFADNRHGARKQARLFENQTGREAQRKRRLSYLLKARAPVRRNGRARRALGREDEAFHIFRRRKFPEKQSHNLRRIRADNGSLLYSAGKFQVRSYGNICGRAYRLLRYRIHCFARGFPRSESGFLPCRFRR